MEPISVPHLTLNGVPALENPESRKKEKYSKYFTKVIAGNKD
jgi:hypothetical protein